MRRPSSRRPSLSWPHLSSPSSTWRRRLVAGAAAITEIGAVRVRGGRRQGEFASLVNPGTTVPPGIADLTGITDWMLASAPR